MLRLIFRTEQKNHQSNKILKKRTRVRFQNFSSNGENEKSENIGLDIWTIME